MHSCLSWLHRVPTRPHGSALFPEYPVAVFWWRSAIAGVLERYSCCRLYPIWLLAMRVVFLQIRFLSYSKVVGIIGCFVEMDVMSAWCVYMMHSGSNFGAFQECPKCHVTIEKDGGCNHMVCKNQTCKSDFCWVCLGPWEPHGSSW